MDRQITEDELASCDGQEGRPAWVAYRGQVYDVSASRLWPAGVHMKRHQVGRDLTAELAAAPHDETILRRLPVVGRLASAEQKELPRLLQMYLDLHPHPVSVHFPIALTVASAAFLVIHLISGIDSLVDGAYFALLGAAAMAPLSAVTGVVSWWYNYRHRLTGTFTGKAGLSVGLVVVGVVTAVLWSFNRDALLDREPVGWVYLALVLAMSGMALSLGKLGGSLLFPPRRKPASKA